MMEGNERPPSGATLASLFQREAGETRHHPAYADDGPVAPSSDDKSLGLRYSWLARRLIADRRARDAVLGADLFYDPPWDMLLELFASHGEGKPNTVKTAVLATACPEATALRWIDRLEDRGLLSRQADLLDSRRIVALTAEGVAAMRNYLEQVASHWDITLVQ